MNIFTHEVKMKGRGDTVIIRPLYDIHYGHSLCDVEALKRTVEEIKNTPNCLWFGGGDMVDCINMSDKRFDPQSVMLSDAKALNNLIHGQCSEIANILMPIKDKGMFLLEGNHEEKAKKQYHISATDIIGSMLKLPAFGYSAYGVLKCSRNPGHFKNIVIFAGHGWGGGKKIGNKINRLVEMGEFIDSHIMYGGHNHGMISDAEVYFNLLSEKTTRLLAKQRFFALGGTFLKTYDTRSSHSGYGEKAGYKPCPIGTVETHIKPFFQKMVNGKTSEEIHIQMIVKSEV